MNTIPYCDNQGVLVICHGSKNSKWVQMIEEACALFDSKLPLEIGYLEMVEGRSIPDGIRKLEERGIEEILIIPLFVSSGSTHLEEIRYMLGLQNRCRIDTDLRPVSIRASLVWCSPLDDHPHLTSILRERIQAESVNPTNESLLLIGHGSNKAGFQEKWEEMLENLTSLLVQDFGFHTAAYATLLPDTIEDRVRQFELHHKQRLIVVPVFLSEGYFTSHVIPKRLEAFPYIQAKELLPHPLVTKWIEERIKSTISNKHSNK